jgi:hypothetical protein
MCWSVASKLVSDCVSVEDGSIPFFRGPIPPGHGPSAHDYWLLEKIIDGFRQSHAQGLEEIPALSFGKLQHP